jgi:hypothetical protein
MKYFLISWLLIAASLFSACDSKHIADDGHNHAVETIGSKPGPPADKHDEEFSGATFEEGKGIRLLDEARKALNIEQLKVNEQSMVFNISVNAQVYRSAAESSGSQGERQNNAYATVLVSPEEATRVRIGQRIHYAFNGDETNKRNGEVWKTETTQLSLLGKTELLLMLPDANHELKIGDFFSVQIPIENPAKTVISVPKSALLETTQGHFVFVANGEFLQRHEVKVGSQNDASIEITEGLKSGDVIVVKPVEVLHLIELKATKGGGHGH